MYGSLKVERLQILTTRFAGNRVFLNLVLSAFLLISSQNPGKKKPFFQNRDKLPKLDILNVISRLNEIGNSSRSVLPEKILNLVIKALLRLWYSSGNNGVILIC